MTRLRKLRLPFKCLAGTLLWLVTLPPGAGAASLPEFTFGEDSDAEAYPQRRVEFANGVEGLADVVYARKPHHRPLTLDLYLPGSESEPGQKLPLIVYVHGGAWVTGTPRENGAFTDFPAVLAALAAQGYLVASVEYRLDGEAKFPAAVDDVRDAIRYLRRHSGRYGLDPARAGIWGSSAGAQLAALVSVACGTDRFVSEADRASAREVDACVQLGVSWYGVHDFATVPTPPGRTGPAPYLGCPTRECPDEVLAYASPSSYVDASDPPILLAHGAADTLVAPSQSTQFRDDLAAADAEVDLLMIPDVDHGFIGESTDVTRQASMQALRATFRFFHRHLREPRESKTHARRRR